MRILSVLLLSFIVIMVSCKKDDNNNASPYPRKYVYNHQSDEFNVWANKAQLNPNPFERLHFLRTFH